MIPGHEPDDPCHDPDVTRANGWWSAELQAVIVSGFDPETAARAMVVTGAVKLAEIAGPRAAEELLAGLAESMAKVSR